MQQQFNEAMPLQSLDEWEDDLLFRYPEPKLATTEKKQESIGIMMNQPAILFMNFTG